MQINSHRQNSLFNYQTKEKAPDGGLWDQFELRLYNHDIARWMAPDPYKQFYSPYISMANNPVNAVDPSGGYSSFPEGYHVFNGQGNNGCQVVRSLSEQIGEGDQLGL